MAVVGIKGAGETDISHLLTPAAAETRAMAFLGKDYTLVKQEKFDAFLRSNGVSDDKIQTMLAHKPSQKITKDGDSYTMTTTSLEGPKVTTFKSGVEFEDVIGADNVPIKSTFTVDGNTITQTIKSGLGSATFTREFNGDDLIVTITSDKFDGVAKRYYKA